MTFNVLHDKISVVDESTRWFTQDGFLKARAVLTRPGDVKYTRKELKKDGEGWVTVYRKPESVEHHETIRSMDGAPVTMGHPPGGVTTKNSKGHVVGALSNPELRPDGLVEGDITIWNGKAIEQLQNGQDDVSIGYDFHLDWKDPYYAETVGPMKVNHVAIVKTGRSGKSVRVMDSLHNPEDISMSRRTIQEIAERIALRVNDSYDEDDLQNLIEEELQEEVRVNDARNEAEQFMHNVADNVRRQERTRHRLITDAMPLLNHRPDLQQALPNMEMRDILLHTVGDSIEDSDEMSDEELIGRFDAIVDMAYNNDDEGYVDDYGNPLVEGEDGNLYYPEEYDEGYDDEPPMTLDSNGMYVADSMPEGEIGPYQGVMQYGDDGMNSPTAARDYAMMAWDKVRAEEYALHGGR